MNFYLLGIGTSNIDGKQVDINDMIIVIVKCIDYSWMDGSESD